MVDYTLITALNTLFVRYRNKLLYVFVDNASDFLVPSKIGSRSVRGSGLFLPYKEGDTEGKLSFYMFRTECEALQPQCVYHISNCEEHREFRGERVIHSGGNSLHL